MKIALAFDSFKGSLSAKEVCETVHDGIRFVRPDVEVERVPMADGGEGTADALMAARGGEWIPMTVTGPLRPMKVDAGYVWLSASRVAVVEMAVASGLPLLKPGDRNPMKTTTYGTGELIRSAIEKGAQKILLTVGGSATVDGGVGAAEALGWTFTESRIIPPQYVQFPEIDVLCDVTNPLCGPNGAAHVYGPQKGATPEMVELLERRLFDLSERVRVELRKEIRDIPGSGAAGGLAFGAMAFMDGRLVPGVDMVMETVGLADALRGAEWVLTGEGKFDSQSLQGKVVDGVARLARTVGAKTGVVAGCVFLDEVAWRAAGVDFAVSLQAKGMSAAESIRRCRELLFEAAVEFARGL